MNERYKQASIIIVGIIILISMILSFGGRDRITAIESGLGSLLLPVQKFLSSVGNFIDEKTDPILNIFEYKTLNENLADENAYLKEQIVRLTMQQKELSELKELKSALKYIDQSSQSHYVSSNVISKDIGNWFNVFTIDAGAKHGVTKNSTVINGSGLIGLVYEVGEDWSKVLAIIDHKSAVGFEMLKITDDYNGVINGTVNYELVGELFDPQAKIKVNDYVVTSGLGMYPKGILIGQIYEVIDDRDALLTRVKVKPVVDFKRIDKVMVIPYTERTKAVEETIDQEDDQNESEGD